MQFLMSLFVGLLLSVSVSAEPLLEGQVRLESGAPAAGVQVRLFDLTNLHQSVGTTTDETGHFTLSLPAAAPGSALPQGFALGQNYPNPFNPSTVIPYQIPTATHVRLEVFNVLGQRLATLVDAEQAAGAHTTTWTATDATGQAVGAGVYIYRLVSGSATTSRRMVLIDGQAGTPATGAASVLPGVSGDRAGQQTYGLVVAGPSIAPYVVRDFRVQAGMAPVEVVVEAHPAGKALGDDLSDLFNLFNIQQEEAEQAEPDSTSNNATSGNDQPGPELIVQSPSVSDSTLTPGQAFTLSATVQNQGDQPAAATTVRYYRSNNATITASDTQIGTNAVGELTASATQADSLALTAPTLALTYFYGACVDPVADESNTDNNCSRAVRVTVEASTTEETPEEEEAVTSDEQNEGGGSDDGDRGGDGGGNSDDHPNTRPLATRLTPGSSLAGQIETGGDVDYFKVQVGQAGTLTVHTTGRLDTKGTLENNAGSALETDDDGGDGNNFRIERAVSAGTYYVKVEGFNSSRTGSYTIHASVSSGGGGGGGGGNGGGNGDGSNGDGDGDGDGDEYTPVDWIQVTEDGGFEARIGIATNILGPEGCVSFNGATFNGVTHYVFGFKWVMRQGSKWVDMPGTEPLEELCGIVEFNGTMPTISGEYRPVLELHRGERIGKYTSSNTLVVNSNGNTRVVAGDGNTVVVAGDVPGGGGGDSGGEGGGGGDGDSGDSGGNGDSGDSGGNAVTGRVTECSGTRNSFTGLVTVTIRGILEAHRPVSFLRVTGYVNGQTLGVDLLDNMSAGQSQYFSISGIASISGNRINCDARTDYITRGSAKVIAGDAESSEQVRLQGSLSPASALLNRKQQLQIGE